MATIFTRIANGEIPSYKVAENEDYYAFLDIAPMAKGHTLVSENEADFMAGKLAAKTPIGMALMGHAVGDVVEAKVPAGVIKFEILDITL